MSPHTFVPCKGSAGKVLWSPRCHSDLELRSAEIVLFPCLCAQGHLGGFTGGPASQTQLPETQAPVPGRRGVITKCFGIRRPSFNSQFQHLLTLAWTDNSLCLRRPQFPLRDPVLRWDAGFPILTETLLILPEVAYHSLWAEWASRLPCLVCLGLKAKVKLLSHVQFFVTPWTARLLCLQDFPGKSTGSGCHFLLQGIFPTQGLNLGLLHCRQTLYHLSHQES